MKKKYKKYEKKVREEFEVWLRKHHRHWLVSKKPIKRERFSISKIVKKEKFPVAKMIKKQKSLRVKMSEKIFEEKTLFETYWLSPDIDVLTYCKASDELMGYEIKKPKYKPKKYFKFKKGEVEISLSAYRNGQVIKYYEELGYEKERPARPHYPDLGIIYESMGQALFNLRYVDQGYLVLPHFDYLCHHSHPIFLNILIDRGLPLGLIEYKYSFSSDDKLKDLEFRIIRKAKNSSLWRYYSQSLQSHKNQIDLLHERKIRDLLKEKLKKHQF